MSKRFFLSEHGKRELASLVEKYRKDMHPPNAPHLKTIRRWYRQNNIANLSTIQGLYDFFEGIDEATIPSTFDAFVDAYFSPEQTSKKLPQNIPNVYHLSLNELGKKVFSFWIEGFLNHSLHEAPPLDLPVTYASHLVEDHRSELPPRDPRVDILERTSNIKSIFEQSTGELLITGQAGTGKTICLLFLAKQLLEDFNRGLSGKVPVVLHLNTWHPKQDIRSWITERLREIYHVPTKHIQFFLDNNQLVLLLDGLDEINTLSYPQCIDALNAFIKESGISIAVCSRSNEYTNHAHLLELNEAVLIQKLDFIEVEEYLTHNIPDSEGLLGALRTSNSLREISSYPLFLDLMTQVYRGVKTSAILTKHRAPNETKSILFEAFVERMRTTKRGVHTSFNNTDIEVWLSRLAHILLRRNEISLSIESVDLSWITDLKSRLVYSLTVALVLGVGVGILLGIFNGSINYIAGGIAEEIFKGEISGRQGWWPWQDWFSHFFVVAQFWACIYTPLFFFHSLIPFDFSKIVSYENIQLLFSGVTMGLIAGLGGLIGAYINSLLYYDGALSMVLTGLTTGFIQGFVIAVILTPGRIELQEKFNFKSPRFKKFILVGFICSVGFGLSAGLGHYYAGLSEDANISAYYLFIGLMIACIIIGARDASFTSNSPPITLHQRLKKLSLYGFGTLVVATLVYIPGYFLSYELPESLEPKLRILLFFLEIARLMNNPLWTTVFVVIVLGGYSVTQHIIIRRVLYQNKQIPWNVRHFLNEATKLMFLRRIGRRSYVFFHKLFLNHFASREDEI